MKNLIINLTLLVLPPTRAYPLKRLIFNFLGHEIGRGTRICGKSKIYGKGKLIIGEDSWIGIGCFFLTSVNGDIYIGSQCDIAPKVSFLTTSHKLGDSIRRAGEFTSNSINILDGSWVGANSTILNGARVGKSSIVAANSLVLSKNYDDSQFLAGVPATVKRNLEN